MAGSDDEREDAGRGAGAGAGAQPQQPRQQQETRQVVKIPLYYGNGTDKITPNQWVETVDRARTINGWTRKQAADAACEAFRSDAEIFRENLLYGEQEEKDKLDDWTQLKTAFCERFQVEDNPIVKSQALQGLKQKPNETAQAFFDRTDNVIKKCLKDALAALPAAATGPQGFIACRKELTLMLFQCGLLPDVRVWVSAGSKGKKLTLAEAKEAALSADEALKVKARPPGPRALAAVDVDCEIAGVATNQPKPGGQATTSLEAKKQEIANLQRELAALQPAGAAKPKAGRGAGGGGRGGGRGGGAGRGRLADKPIQQRDWILCHRCGQWGQHLSIECKIGADEMAKLQRQTDKDKPSGPAWDSQFPN